jgi:hypothetical protein
MHVTAPLSGTREADAPDAVDLNDGRTNKYPITACRLGGNPSDYPCIHTDRS